MEDVQQRRQRLAAMREQAALEDDSDAAVSKNVPSPGNSLNLPSPMIDSQPVTAVGTNKASGFDFYTDPLTAFTNAKRRKPAVGVLGGAPSAGPGVLQAPQWQPAPGPPPVLNHLVMHPPPPPFSVHQGWQPIPYEPPLVAPGLPSPLPPPPPYSMGQPPNFSNQSHGRGIDMGFGGRGRGMYGSQGSYASDFSGQGRGYGRSSNNSWNSGSGASGSGGHSGRGGPARGLQGRGDQRGITPSAKDQPQRYFKQSMVEDPWKGLEEKLKGMQRTECHKLMCALLPNMDPELRECRRL